jgi:hypothetical protein
MLNKTPTAGLQDTVDGRTLSYALRGATPQQRAAVAGELVTGALQISRPTRKQAGKICEVRPPLVAQAVNGNGNGKPGSARASAIAVSWWDQASPEARVDFVRAAGVAEVWDALATAVT